MTIINDNDVFFMNNAIIYAQKAYFSGEVPVGAVITCEGKVVSCAYNMREKAKNALRHAELDAIKRACYLLGGWRLQHCTLYVTLEPCPMCAGAVINSRIRRVVYGAKDSRAGAFGSVINLNNYPFNHKPEITGGICEEECSRLMRLFFSKLRESRKKTR